MSVELVEQINTARGYKYSDDEIIHHLQNSDPQVRTAVEAGYKPKEIIEHLLNSAAEVEAGGKKFSFDNAQNAAGFKRGMTGSAVPADQMAMQYGGKPVVEEIPAARQPAVGGIRRGFSGGAQNRAVTRAAASSVVAPFASAADTTVGSIIPGIYQQFGYPVARAFGQTPEEATATVGRFSAPLQKPFGRAFGVTETPEYKNEASQRLTQFIGENVEKGSKWLSQQTGLPEQDITNIIGSASLLAGPTIAKIPTKLGERQADKAIAASDKSWAEAPRIEAAQAAQRLGVLLNPAESNPNKLNIGVSALAGGKAVSEGLAKKNAPRWTELAKEEMGMPKNTILEPAAFDKAREALSGPYERIRAIGTINADLEFLAALDNLGAAETIGGASSDAVAKLAAQAKSRAGAPIDGDLILQSIKQRRHDAQQTYKRENSASPPSAEELAMADANMKLANALEDLAARNVYDPRFKAELQAARAEMAKTYAYERATNFATGKVDPNVIAKLVNADPDRYTGTIRDIGKIAGNFPDIAAVKESNVGVGPRLYRSTPSVLLGTAVGTAVGTTPIVGAALGAVAGSAGSNLLRRGAATSAVQKRFAAPSDNRLRVDMPEQEAVVNNLTASPLLENLQLSPKQRRAFEMAREDMARPPPAPPPAPPTTGGVELQFDPFTNKLRPVESTGAPLPPQNELAIAVGKISRGERATLSATEKIAWDKAQADLTIVDPAYRSLTPDEIANRMSDRKSVEAAVKKAREKAAGFDEIARRAKDQQAVQLAHANRERMIDFAEELEDRLNTMPTVKYGQGPKTRAAKTLPPVVVKATRLPFEE